jgi:diguanylate cyclase (GGDEF)-like protein
MISHPHPSRTGRERLAFYLDSATVLVGGLVVAWSFGVSPENTSRSAILATLGAAAAAITSGFAAIKMILSGNAPMHRAAAIPMMTSAGFTTIGVFLETPASGDLPAYYYLIRFIPSLLITIGPWIQVVIAGFDAAPFGERRRKPYSLLPYGSIVIAFGALLVVMPHGVDARMWGVVAGLGLICALVAGRQLAAFHDNTALIRRLDATLAELREHEARLRYQALYDGLTSLANRTHFHEEVGAALAEPGQISVLLVDLDGFKAVNDSLGHGAGDELLVAVADKLRAALRTGDVAARLGGDEFAILLRDSTQADAGRTAERILESLTVAVPISGTEIVANASIGAAEAEPGDDVSLLLRRADLAMYAAKSAGKGNWLCWQPGMQHSSV